jgi:hypothetical protein
MTKNGLHAIQSTKFQRTESRGWFENVSTMLTTIFENLQKGLHVPGNYRSERAQYQECVCRAPAHLRVNDASQFHYVIHVDVAELSFMPRAAFLPVNDFPVCACMCVQRKKASRLNNLALVCLRASPTLLDSQRLKYVPLRLDAYV